jgi:hypothetical protein
MKYIDIPCFLFDIHSPTMLILKIIIFFLVGYGCGFSLKKFSWLRFLFFLGLLSLSILLTWFVVAALFSTVFEFDYSKVITAIAFSAGAYIGYVRTKFSNP